VRILLVEDDTALASAVCSYLEAKAFVVDVAPGLADARAALSGVQYAAVLLDLHLGDGELKQDHRHGRSAVRFLDVESAHHRDRLGREIMVERVIEKANDLIKIQRQDDDMQAVIQDLLGPATVAVFVGDNAAGVVVRLLPVLRPQRHDSVTVCRRGDAEGVAGEGGAVDSAVLGVIRLEVHGDRHADSESAECQSLRPWL